MRFERASVPVTYMRGGTSKALFFHEQDLPPPGEQRDRLILRFMGSPDPMQIDGMGGSHVVTSKVAIVKSSDREDADVDYTFVQVGIDSKTIGYTGNCGNISAAVGPFALNEGLVRNPRKGVSLDGKLDTVEVRIFNTGSKKVLVSHVPVDPATGRTLEKGDFAIAGCPGTGAPILMDYKNTVGGALGRGIFPTGKPLDETQIDNKTVPFTICDVGNLLAFAMARDIGISGNESPAAINSDKDLIAKVKQLRGKIAVKVGKCKDWTRVDEESPMMPMVVLISLPTIDGAHIQSRLFLDNRCHTSMAGTGAICTAACSRLPSSLVHNLLGPTPLQSPVFNIQHPSGIIPISLETDSSMMKDGLPNFKTLSFIRTARYIFQGSLFIPDDLDLSLIQENI